MITATAYFANDTSVGIRPTYYNLDLPIDEFDSKETREWVRKNIKDLYTEMNGEFACSWVSFSDESDSD